LLKFGLESIKEINIYLRFSTSISAILSASTLPWISTGEIKIFTRFEGGS
jgi:hypothetical protein